MLVAEAGRNLARVTGEFSGQLVDGFLVVHGVWRLFWCCPSAVVGDHGQELGAVLVSINRERSGTKLLVLCFLGRQPETALLALHLLETDTSRASHTTICGDSLSDFAASRASGSLELLQVS